MASGSVAHNRSASQARIVRCAEQVDAQLSCRAAKRSGQSAGGGTDPGQLQASAPENLLTPVVKLTTEMERESQPMRVPETSSPRTAARRLPSGRPSRIVEGIPRAA